MIRKIFYFQRETGFLSGESSRRIDSVEDHVCVHESSPGHCTHSLHGSRFPTFASFSFFSYFFFLFFFFSLQGLLFLFLRLPLCRLIPGLLLSPLPYTGLPRPSADQRTASRYFIGFIRGNIWRTDKGALRKSLGGWFVHFSARLLASIYL